MARTRFQQTKAINASDKSEAYNYLLRTLKSNVPGTPTANLYELSRQYTGMAYLAIHSLMKLASTCSFAICEANEDQSDGDIELPHSDPAYQLLKNPNPRDGFPELISQIVQQLSITGIAHVWHPPTEEMLFSLPSAAMLAQPPSEQYPHGAYTVQNFYPSGFFNLVTNAQGTIVPAEQVTRILEQHPLLWYGGHAILTAAGRENDTLTMANQARWSMMKQGARPSVSLEFDPNLFNPSPDDFERTKENLRKLYAGPLNDGSIFFNPVGSKITNLKVSAQELDFVNSWLQLSEFVLAVFGTSKAVVGLHDGMTFATLHAALRQNNILTMEPLLLKIAGPISKFILQPYYGEKYYLKLKPRAITDDDLVEKRFANDLKAGNVIKVNERRKMIGLEPLDGAKGEAFCGETNVDIATSADTAEPIDPENASRPDNEGGIGSGVEKRRTA